ncbi:MAG: 50S ribosomal protein L11 [Candidatus Methanoliparum thermophilum]|uniref:Large ribosomal subunit protein uL11 n=1 Tax=Methanoliparum thermophilum TaxID=2491083 RepID=A0A520KTL1_METT2|nr:50S ribosomal protein L11 [Candidatus Methanoliparum sp. LAM-1]RZN65408.1 MAG: 50S ribosomal protein L11 [Candidatus Methanoliparum thermophilum]BDC35503.1 50S ribosomal protein L11 [Candidatus Methanoliparum sp. LAM-1]
MTDIVEFLVPGGKATAGPPVGPALGPLGVNIKQIVDEINKVTKEFEGMQIPVKVIIEDNKSFSIEIGSPPTAELIKKEVGLEKGSSQPGKEFVGNISLDNVKKIAKIKINSMLSHKLKDAVKEVIGTCQSVGVKVEDLPPKEMEKKIENGEYDRLFG